MLFTIAILVLTRSPPNYDEKLITGCYDYEDKAACDRRHERWNSDIKAYNDEMADYEADDFKQLTNSKVSIEPAEGVEKVAPLKPTWCDGADTNSQWASIPRNLGRFLESGADNFGLLFQVAAMTCKRPDDKDVQRFAGYAVQGYANITHVSPELALRNFTWRMSETPLKGKKTLCEALAIDEEAIGSAKAFGRAKYNFFGCSDPKSLSSQWTSGNDNLVFDSLQYYLDSAE